MITIILISIIYTFAINNLTVNSKIQKTKITLDNLKKNLLKIDFEEKVEIKCIDDKFSCFLFIDGDIQKEKIKPLFKEKPTIYEYSKELEKIEFQDLDLEELERYNIVFEYSCTKEKRCSELIVETSTNTYIFNDIYKKPQVIQYITNLDEYFENKIREVKDAF
jgi:hypothetical protein